MTSAWDGETNLTNLDWRNDLDDIRFLKFKAYFFFRRSNIWSERKPQNYILKSNYRGWYQPFNVCHSNRYRITVCSAETMSVSHMMAVDVLASHRIVTKTAVIRYRVVLGSNHLGWYQALSVYHSHRCRITVCSAERMSDSVSVVINVLPSHRIQSKTAIIHNQVMLGPNYQGWYQPPSVYHSHRYRITVCSTERMSVRDLIVAVNFENSYHT